MNKRGARSWRKKVTKSPAARRAVSVAQMFSLMSPLFNTLSSPTTPRRGRRPKPRAAKTAVPAGPVETITLDDTPESIEILDNVTTKVGDFMKSGCFISSDEEDEAAPVARKGMSVSLMDDKDDVALYNVPDLDQPGTSSSNIPRDPPNPDDVMEFVDLVLEKAPDKPQDSLKDLKSLEDFRKETEEMLKNAATLFDEFKTGKKAEPEPKPNLEDSPAKKGLGDCPICLEALGKSPAASTVCGHIFCKDCITETVKKCKKCPTCRKALTLKKIHPLYI